MAKSWENRAKKAGGSYKITFDLPDSFSLKYNAVWDIAFGTSLFDAQGLQNEIKSYLNKQNEYGVPLDNRADYTKSDWILWCASMSEDKEVFGSLVEPVWKSYDKTATRCPMGDWYDTKDAKMINFRNRTVQGAMFMPILLDEKKLKFYDK